jgi:hypothetical protein
MSKGSCGLYCFMLLQKYKLWVKQKADKADNVHQLHSEEGFFLATLFSMFVFFIACLFGYWLH